MITESCCFVFWSSLSLSAWTPCMWWFPAHSAHPSPLCCLWPHPQMLLSFPTVTSKCQTWWVLSVQYKKIHHKAMLTFLVPPHRLKQELWWTLSALAASLWPLTAGVAWCLVWTHFQHGPMPQHLCRCTNSCFSISKRTFQQVFYLYLKMPWRCLFSSVIVTYLDI